MINTLRIAFDVDGTLIGDADRPRWEVIALLKSFSDLGHHVIVWSGSGTTYAEMWVRRLFLEDYVKEIVGKTEYAGPVIDIVFDDKETRLGRVDVQV